MPAKILIVDDDRRILWAISVRLEKLGCQCVACNNAVEAMLHFAAGNVDLVITDLTMPQIDGLGVIGLIRAQSNVPVIVVTGHADEYAAFVSRFSDITLIRKPFSSDMLVSRVCQVLELQETVALV